MHSGRRTSGKPHHARTQGWRLLLSGLRSVMGHDGVFRDARAVRGETILKKSQVRSRKNADVEKILSRINHRVGFKYPEGEPHKTGILKDRAVVRSNPGKSGVPYWDVVDLIEFEGTRHQWIRIGYYRVPRGRLQWGSQTTIAEPVATWKRVLVEAGKQKQWFRELLLDVAAELNR
jgi:hypothetical protein